MKSFLVLSIVLGLASVAPRAVVAAEKGVTAAAQGKNSREPGRDSRLFTGGGIGTVGGAVRIDGRETPSGGREAGGALEAGYSHSLLTERFALTALGRYALGSDAWSHARGETMQRVDLGLGPELKSVGRGRKNLRLTGRISLPVGYSVAWLKPGPKRAVTEEYSTAHGFNVGLLLGLDLSGRRSGGYFQFTYIVRPLWFRRSAGRGALPEADDTEDHQMVEQQWLFGGGYLFLL